MRTTVVAARLRTTVATRLAGIEWQIIYRAVTRDAFAIVEHAMCGGPQLVIGRIHTCISQFMTKARRLPILVFVGWLLGLCVADGELRLVALDWHNPQGLLAMLHIGVSLPEQSTADTSHGRCVRQPRFIFFVYFCPTRYIAISVPGTSVLCSVPKSIGRTTSNCHEQGAFQFLDGESVIMTLPHLNVLAGRSRTVCLSINGSSRGCFDGDNSPNGALIPVNQAGIAWITGHFRAESGNALTTRPLAIDIPPSFAPISPLQAAEDGLVWSRGGDAQPIQSSASGKISAVLLVTLKDVDLALLLLATLRARGAMTLFGDFFVVVPSAELERIETILRQASFITAHDSKGVVLVDERRLLPRDGKIEPWWSKYALQMALKLLVSSLIRTEYYLTLDADILCSKAGLSEEDLLPEGKGNYVPEA